MTLKLNSQIKSLRSRGGRDGGISLGRVPSLKGEPLTKGRRPAELPGGSNPEACGECSPSSPPLRKSVAKVFTNSGCKAGSPRKGKPIPVPVVTSDRQPFMPTSACRARKMIKNGKATPFFSKGIFCVRLNQEPATRNLQPIALGVDPGSKMEGFSVVGVKETFLNVQTDARTQVSKKVENRRELRRNRRKRKTPCRQPRSNRASLRGNRPPPSTRARWAWKLRMIKWLKRLYPISIVAVEDIAAKTLKGKRRWNRSFSPLETGKAWFYAEIKTTGLLLVLRKGYETKALRDRFGLAKSRAKLSEGFDAHCVDAWVLAAEQTGAAKPSHQAVLRVIFLNFRRRALHLQTPSPGGWRREHGGSRSLGWRRGALVKAEQYGLVYLGGSSSEGLSLHGLATGDRLARVKKPELCRILAYNSTRFYWVVQTKGANFCSDQDG